MQQSLPVPFFLSILVPLIVSEDEQHKYSPTLRLLGLFLLGRFGGYLSVGLVTGLVGSRIFKFGKGSPQVVLTLLIGVILLVFGLMKNFPHLKLCKIWPGGRSSAGWGVVLGFLTGLSICPPFLAAMTASAALGSLQGSVFYFTAFFLRNSPLSSSYDSPWPFMPYRSGQSRG